MKRVKRVLNLCAFLMVASVLSGCVVVPVPYGYGGGYHHYRR